MPNRDRSSRWERVKSVFGEAVELDAVARAEYLDRAVGDEPEVRREVESLLAAHERADALMARPTRCGKEDPTAAGVGEIGSHVPAASPDASALPESVGRYRILSLLGKGGMGEVYLAHEPILDRHVALKLMPADLTGQRERRGRMLREARAAASLNHAGIATIHEIGQADGRDYIAFEYLDGCTLQQRLAQGELSLEGLIDIALPLAEALAYAHEQGVVHRDVKAANVMLTADGLPKLVDFGVAKLLPADAPPDGAAPPATRTVAGAVFGTPGAMSPEQALGRQVDHRTDVFSFGSLLHEMATGRAAFEEDTAMATMDAVLHAEPASLEERRPDLPAALGAIVRRALCKDPDGRYQDMAELASDLVRLRQAGPRAAPPVDANRPRQARGRRAAGLALLGAVLALLAWWNGWLQREPGGGDPSTTGPYVGVMYFDNLADREDSDQLGAMLARALTADLSAGGNLQLLSQQRLFDVARLNGRADGRIDRSVATEIARKAGVGAMILGQVGPAGDGLLATAELMDVASGRTLGSSRAQGAGAGDVFAMAESLGRQIRGALRAPDMTAAERSALEQQLTSSVDAFRAYVRGQQALQHARIDDAVTAFGEAASIDPAFALAHYRQAMAMVWTGVETQPTFERALAFRDRLPEDLRSVLDGIGPYLFNDRMSEALPFLQGVIERDPYHRDALYHLGEIYTHSSLWNDVAQAARTYERFLELDPAFSLLYEHLLSAYLREGRFQMARARLRLWEAAAPQDAVGLNGTLALWEGRLTDAAAALGDSLEMGVLTEASDSPAVRAVLSASVDEIVAGMRDVHGVYRVLGLDLRATVLAYHGRFDAAAKLYRMASEAPGYLGPDGYITNTRNGARHRLAFLLALKGDLAGARHLAREALALQPDSYRCRYVALLLALRQPDLPAARRHLARLTDLAGQGWSPTAALYHDAAAAEMALAEGRAAEAREAYQTLVDSGRLMEDWYAFDDSVGPLLRDGLARACLALGDNAGAGQALDDLIHSGLERLRHPLPWTRALFTRGMQHIEAGNEAKGRELLSRFLAYWGQADWELPEVAQARQRLGQ